MNSASARSDNCVNNIPPDTYTRDFDFADIRNYPPKDYAGIIVLELPDDAVAAQVNQVLRSLVSKPELLSRLTGRLAIVESWRVRFRRQAPTT